MAGDDKPTKLDDAKHAYWPEGSGTIETKAHRVERLRAEQAELNSKAGVIMSLDLHSERLAQLAEVERQLRALGETP